MILLIQFGILALAFLLKRRRLVGSHLRPSRDPVLGSGTLEYVSRSKWRVVGRHLGLARERAFPLLVVRERWYHGLMKRLGLATEIQLGDAALDAKWFIITDYPDQLQRALASRELREGLTALLALPIVAVRAVGKRVWIEIARPYVAEPGSHFVPHLEQLRKVQHELAQVQMGGPGSRVAPRRSAALLFVGVHAALLGVGVFGLVPEWFGTAQTLEVHKLLVTSATVGAGGAAGWLLLLFRTFRGTAWAGWVFGDFLLSGLLGILLTSWLLVHRTNMLADLRPARVEVAPVLSKRCELACRRGSGKGARTAIYPLSERQCQPRERSAIYEEYRVLRPECATAISLRYHATVRHWRGGERSYAFRPSSALFDQLGPGSLVEIPIRAGAWNVEWVEPSLISLRGAAAR